MVTEEIRYLCSDHVILRLLLVASVFLYVCMMGGLCRFHGTGCRSAAMAAPLASSGPARCKAVLHGYGTSPLEGELYRLVTVCTHGDFIVLPHWNTRPLAP